MTEPREIFKEKKETNVWFSRWKRRIRKEMAGGEGEGKEYTSAFLRCCGSCEGHGDKNSRHRASVSVPRGSCEAWPEPRV